MSNATYSQAQDYYSKYDYAQYIHDNLRKGPKALTAGLIATAVAVVFTGAAVSAKMGMIPDVDPAAAVGPVTPYTGMQWQEEAARKSGVVHGKLAVLTTPVYANGPRIEVAEASVAEDSVYEDRPAAEQVSAEVTGGEVLADHLYAYPTAQAALAAVEAQAETATAIADATSDEIPRYVLPEEVAPPAQIMEEPPALQQSNSADDYVAASELM